MNWDHFRTNGLAVIGMAGYLLSFVLAVGVMFGYPVSPKLVAVILLASASASGVDFASDFAPIQINFREKK